MKYLLLSIASLCILSTVTGLACVSCAADNDCNDNVHVCTSLAVTVALAQVISHKPTLEVIPSTSFDCFKLVVELADETKTKHVIKGCTYDSTDVCAGSPVLGEQKICHTCSENECNGTSNSTQFF